MLVYQKLNRELSLRLYKSLGFLSEVLSVFLFILNSEYFRA